jgi:hypothetical protein
MGGKSVNKQDWVVGSPKPSLEAQAQLAHAMQHAQVQHAQANGMAANGMAANGMAANGMAANGMAAHAMGQAQNMDMQQWPKTLSPTEMLKARLTHGRLDGGVAGFEFLHAHPIGKTEGIVSNKVIVLVVTSGGNGVTLEDDAELFPSDTLITQLRML